MYSGSMENKAHSIEDPESLKALAHPLRLRLLSYIQEMGSATATQCAEHTGESVASCSFHLRQLAKYGFIERGESKGREKPWQAISSSYQARPQPDQPENTDAVLALAQVQARQEMQRAFANMEKLQQDPDKNEWLSASSVVTSAAWLTSEELAEVSEALGTLLTKYHNREEADQRPAGAQRVRVFSIAVPDLVSPLNEPQE